MRIASPEAISCLLSHAADPNALCAESKEGMNASTERLGSPSTPVFNVPTSTPLSLILATAASFNESCSAYTHSRVDRLEHPEKISARRGACRAWVLVAGILLRAGMNS